MQRAWWLALLSLTLPASQVLGATQESAEVAVTQAFPQLPLDRVDAVRALIPLLAAMRDGDAIVVQLEGFQPTAFMVEGDAVTFQLIGEEATPSEPSPAPAAEGGGSLASAGGDCRSALVYTLGHRVEIDPLKTELERNSRQMEKADAEAVSFILQEDIVTVTAKGVVCVRSGRSLADLGAVDQLGSESREAVRYLQKVNAKITDALVAEAWPDRRYYSDPPHTHKWVLFHSGGRDMGFGTQWIPADFRVDIKIPKIEVKVARLCGWASGGYSWHAMPALLLDNQPITRGNQMPGMGMGGDSFTVDATEVLRYGDHMITAAQQGGRPCLFQIDVIADPPEMVDFQVSVGGQAYTSKSSQPIEALIDHWPDLAGLLP